MGTRAYIGIKNTNGKVTAIYNHSDGGPENLGYLLKKYFNTEDKVRELLNLECISSVQDIKTYKELKEQFKLFNENEWKKLQSVSECRVRIMPVDESAEEFDNIEKVIGGMICFAYLFIPEKNKWYYTKGNGLKSM